MRGVFAMRPHPTPKHIHMNIEVSSCLTDRDTPIQYQLYCLNLELPTEPPSRTHAVPPIPKEHLKMVSTEPGTSHSRTIAGTLLLVCMALLRKSTY
jgi:hypothetical protein